MSALRQRLRKPRTWVFLVLILLVVAAGADSFRPPDRQLTAKIYISALHGYQRWGRPISNKFIRCRYHPTSSRYSIEAEGKNEIPQGPVYPPNPPIPCRDTVPL